MRRAFLDVDADIYVLADADETYPANRVHDLIQPIAEGRADMVVGDRHSGRTLCRREQAPLARLWKPTGPAFGEPLIQRQARGHHERLSCV